LSLDFSFSLFPFLFSTSIFNLSILISQKEILILSLTSAEISPADGWNNYAALCCRNIPETADFHTQALLISLGDFSAFLLRLNSF